MFQGECDVANRHWHFRIEEARVCSCFHVTEEPQLGELESIIGKKFSEFSKAFEG